MYFDYNYNNDKLNTMIARICLFLLLTIVEVGSNDCSDIDCFLVFPICPPDSVLVKPQAEQGQCCAQEATCNCDETHCSKLTLKCNNGMERIRVRKGTGKPGQCCDQFECRMPERHCDPNACSKPNEITDLHTLSNDSCPEDSFRPPSFVPIDECCLVISDCRCKASICNPVRCSNNELVVVDRKGDGVPGRCCDSFHCESKAVKTQCFVNGIYYADGEQWNSEDSCETCSCTNGVKLCRQLQCAPVSEHCNWVGIADGTCCPTCLGCRDDDGEPRAIDESWIKDDCTNCTCDETFKPSCQRNLCKVECENPRKVDGQCCPVCDFPLIVETPLNCASVDLCPLRCDFGLLKNQWGCFECECATEPHKLDTDEFQPVFDSAPKDCPKLNAQNCKKQCAHGYLRDEKDCPSCKCAHCPSIDQCYKQCLYGFETNSLGCSICKCRSKSTIDARLTVGDTVVKNLHDVCLSRDKETGKLTERDGGEWWSDNKCRQCFCQQNTEFCSLITCPRRPSDCPANDWVIRQGDCCPSCSKSSQSQRHQLSSDHILTVCHSPGNGRLFVDGETWKLGECVTCTCRVGHVLCSSKQCPAIPCENPIESHNDQCCKTCPDTNTSSVIHVNIGYCIDKSGNSHPIHSNWREDDCRSCFCSEDGTVRCYEENCEALDSLCNGRALMIKGRCCPVCSDSLGGDSFCSYKENIYALNEEFHDGHCRNCTCKQKGIVECVEKQCHYCEEPIFSPNNCCPICQEERLLLEANGQTVYLDNKFAYFIQPMLLYIILTALSLIILVFCVICFVRMGKCIYKKKKLTSIEKSKMNTRNGTGNNKRSGSECESANVSLLSTETKDVSLSPATSLIVHEDRGTIQKITTDRHDRNDRMPHLQSQFV